MHVFEVSFFFTFVSSALYYSDTGLAVWQFFVFVCFDNCTYFSRNTRLDINMKPGIKYVKYCKNNTYFFINSNKNIIHSYYIVKFNLYIRG